MERICSQGEQVFFVYCRPLNLERFGVYETGANRKSQSVFFFFFFFCFFVFFCFLFFG